MTILEITYVVIIGIFLPGILCLNNIHMLQQNSYRNSRYCKWLSFSNYLTTFRIGGKQKKPLVYTPRVWRLIATSTILLTIMIFIIIAQLGCYWCTIIPMLAFAIILAANSINQPIEYVINRKYYNDAERILKSMPHLTIIGITGSYGKTSTKHYLHKILSEKFVTLMTPGSFNTTMGVIRTIREQLKPYHQVFIVEMGAKQIGDIKEICQLVNPTIGIITAVAEQHMETFHTLNNVLKTKFELADSLPAHGIAVVNNDFPAIEQNKSVYKCKTIRYGNNDSSYHIGNVSYSGHGTEFDVISEKWSIKLQTSLVGQYNLSNLMASVIVAKEMGLSDQQIKTGVLRVEQVEHRLSIKRHPNGITVIDDAFNSNPYGARMALEVLSNFPKNRIVVTPGMIELGDKQFDENRKFGIRIAQSADIAIVVNKLNSDAICQGLHEGGMCEDNIKITKNFFEATSILNQISKSGDTILYENDLPDMFQ